MANKTNRKRVELYRRLPEIYRIKDADLPKLYLYNDQPAAPYQLRSYLEPVEEMFSAIHENIESLYHDLFIETCDEWVIPYIGDLLGASGLSGDEWTLRADIADTIAVRRRKGTLGAVELLAFILTKWGVHCVELQESMVWNQHLNHQRPDEGGAPPFSLPTFRRATPVRGGTVSLRDPSLLAQLNTAFDPFAHVADVKPHEIGQVRYNLPNLAIYLWRLEAYRLKTIKPHIFKVTQKEGAPRVVRVNVDPVPVNKLSRPYVKTPPKFTVDNSPEGRPATLFNTNHFGLFTRSREGTDALNLSAIAPRVSSADNVPGPIPVERISDRDIAEAYDKSLESPTPQPLEFFTDASFTAPQEYLAVDSYDETGATDDAINISDVGLQLHLPKDFAGEIWPHRKKGRHWTIRGENLCAWERELDPPVGVGEIAIDPARGRICIGIADDARAKALEDNLLVTFTYGAAGAVGAHPISYPELPKDLDHNQTPAVIYKQVSFENGASDLQNALAGISTQKGPVVIEITDSQTYPLDISALAADIKTEKGTASLMLNASLVIRAADGERPIIELIQPLAFRPAKTVGKDIEKQGKIDARVEAVLVRLEGLYIARGENYGAGLPLISRAAIGQLEIMNCTLDPGGFNRHITDAGLERAPQLHGIELKQKYGFDDSEEEKAFKQTPQIIMQRSITGAIFTDEGYRLCISDSIVESVPVNVSPEGKPPVELPFSIASATDPVDGYAGAAIVENVTILGRVRTASIDGSGGIFKELLEVFDQQIGCLKFCYFAGDPINPAYGTNRLPPHFAFVSGSDAKLIFTSEIFGQPGYCQLSLESDPRILEEGPGVDQMGAFNFLSEAHKWRNLKIRFREFMPVGIRPLLIPVT